MHRDDLRGGLPLSLEGTSYYFSINNATMRIGNADFCREQSRFDFNSWDGWTGNHPGTAQFEYAMLKVAPF